MDKMRPDVNDPRAKWLTEAGATIGASYVEGSYGSPTGHRFWLFMDDVRLPVLHDYNLNDLIDEAMSRYGKQKPPEGEADNEVYA